MTAQTKTTRVNRLLERELNYRLAPKKAGFFLLHRGIWYLRFGLFEGVRRTRGIHFRIYCLCRKEHPYHVTDRNDFRERYEELEFDVEVLSSQFTLGVFLHRRQGR